MQQKNKSIKIELSDYLKSILILFITFLVIVGLFSLQKFVLLGHKTNSGNILHFLYFSLTILLIFSILFLYLSYFDKVFFLNRKNLYLICTLIIITLEIDLLFGLLNIYLRPYALIVMFATIFISKHIGFFCGLLSLVLIILFDFFANNYTFNQNYQFTEILAGFFICVLAVVFTSTSSRRFRTLMIGLKLAIPLFVLSLVNELLFNNSITISLQNAAISAFSGILTIVLYITILPIFEKCFNLVTVYMLVELTDHDKILIKRLMNEAPGTFNHCLAVANLAEACAAAIGENVQMARAAAYYHDVGKLNNPLYFSENQGDYNPHDDLTPELSTDIIKKHIKDGYNLARKHKLPVEIADICMQHHGTMPIKVFYYKALKFTEGTLDITNFCYDGVRPKTKIAAIIMIVDASEAAIRALNDHSRTNVEETVNAIIEERLDLGQFTDCDITLKEIYAMRDTIVNNFTGMYHSRLKYPKIKLKAASNSSDIKTEG